MSATDSTPSTARMLASLPQAIAGQCVGTVGDALVVAGGSTWSAAPWDGGVKNWSAAIYSLRSLDGAWQTEAPLKTAMAYGASAQWGDSLLCVGGQNATQTFKTVLRFRSERDGIVADQLPPLPKPLTNAAAAVVGDTLYVVGGQSDLTPASVSRELWSLPLNRRGHTDRWSAEPAVPWTHARILPVAAACGGSLYVMSGASLAADANGAPVRTYLRDVWIRDAHGRWKQLADLPEAAVAAPVLCGAHGSPIVFGGDDGKLAAQIPTLRDRHPGFSKTVRELDPASGTWKAVAQMPLSLVTTAAARWNQYDVVAGGENQPGHRSATVIALPMAR